MKASILKTPVIRSLALALAFVLALRAFSYPAFDVRATAPDGGEESSLTGTEGGEVDAEEEEEEEEEEEAEEEAGETGPEEETEPENGETVETEHDSGLDATTLSAMGFELISPMQIGSTPITVTLSHEEEEPRYGDSLTLTATLSDLVSDDDPDEPAEIPVTGTISFYYEGDDLVPGGENISVADNQASFTIQNIPHGSLSFIAKYSGDAEYEESDSAAHVVNVGARQLELDVGVDDKNYDGAVMVETWTAALAAGGVINGDDVSLDDYSGVTAEFADKATVEEDTEVAIVFDGDFALTGDDMLKYALIQPTGVTAWIYGGFSAVLDEDYYVSAADGESSEGAAVHGWYVSEDMVVTVPGGYGIILAGAGEPGPGTTWEDSLTVFANEADTDDGKLRFYLKRDDGSVSRAVTVTYQRDQTVPVITAMTHSHAGAWPAWNDMEAGFLGSALGISLEAEDATAGIHKVEWQYSGAKAYYDDEIVGAAGGKITQYEPGADGQWHLNIAPQYFGRDVRVTVFDKAGNKTETRHLFEAAADDDKHFIIDSVAPRLTDVDYGAGKLFQKSALGRFAPDNPDGIGEFVYYDTAPEITFVMDEGNFDADSVLVTVKAFDRDNLDAGYSLLHDKSNGLIDWQQVEAGGPLFRGVLTLPRAEYGDGDYVVEMEYTDHSGNAMETFLSRHIVVDTAVPVLTLSYDNNDVRNGRYFNKARTATLRVTERNFRAVDMAFVVSVTEGASGNFRDFVANEANWTKVAGMDDLYEVKVSFSGEGNYSLSIAYADIPGNSADGVNHGTSAAPYAFTIDMTDPTGSLRIDEWTASIDGTKWEQFLSTITFGYFSRNTAHVTIQSADNLSGVYRVDHLRSPEPLSLSQVQSSGGWVAGSPGSSNFSVTPDERMVVYARITDRAGNMIIINSDGVILDQTNPDVGVLSAEISIAPVGQADHGIYSGDVAVNISVSDPATTNGDVYSGLKQISYRVYNLGVLTQEETLFEFTNRTPTKDQLVPQWQGSIVVSAAQNNSNDVKVVVHVQDNAENVGEEEIELKIDITAPIINVRYDNNANDPLFTEYFKENRTATIAITERNFDPEVATRGVTIANAEGAAPVLSSWVKTSDGAGGNDDGIVHEATILFANDGIYTWEMEYADMAGNESEEVDYGSSVQPTAFTLDKTLPVIAVTYDNDDVHGGEYYQVARTATITINEHNFETGRVEISGRATYDGNTIEFPDASAFTRAGSVHTATIPFAADGRYTFAVSYRDMAGNDAETFNQEEFFVDTEKPHITISGVGHETANNGEVMPVVTVSDTNFDRAGVQITLTGSRRGGPLELVGEYDYESVHNGLMLSFADFERKRETDDIYTLSVRAADRAGNEDEASITFSVNRFGSNYELCDVTKGLNDKVYTNEDISQLVITEVNADVLRDTSRVTMVYNGNPRDLREGDDFHLDEEIGGDWNESKAWSRYAYTLPGPLFAGDGSYIVSFHSVDAAGNVNENVEDGEMISFIVDKTPPIVLSIDLENGAKPYNVPGMDARFIITDNLMLGDVVIARQEEGKDAVYTNVTPVIKGDEYIISIPEYNGNQYVKVTTTDMAGNMIEYENGELIIMFSVTTNPFYRWYLNKPLFVGTLVGVGVVGAASVGLLEVRRRRKLKVAEGGEAT